MSSAKYSRLDDGRGVQDTHHIIDTDSEVLPDHIKNDEENAGFISRVFFLWVGRVVSLANQRKKEEGGALQVDDLGTLSKADKTGHNHKRFKRCMDATLERSRLWNSLAANHAQVEDKKGNRGTLKYIGRLVYGPNKYVYHCGVEWDTTARFSKKDPAGDGYYMGEKIFDCRPGYGSFVRPKEIRPLAMNPEGKAYTWKDVRPEAPSVGGALFSAFRYPLLLSGIAKFVQTASLFIQPEVVRRLTLYLAMTPIVATPSPGDNFTDLAGGFYSGSEFLFDNQTTVEYESRSWQTGVIYIALMVIGQFISSLAGSWYTFLLYRVGLQVRNVLSAVIFDKSLTISQKSESHPDFSVGNKVNLIDKDTERVRELFWTIHDIWAAPAVLTAALILLYDLAGKTVFSALGSLAVVMPVLGVCIMMMMGPIKMLAKIKDRRIKTVSEVLESVRIVKYMVWEDRFSDQVDDIRQEEIDQLQKQHKWYSGLIATIIGSGALLNATFFFTYVYTGHELTPEIVFTSQLYFGMLRNPTIVIPTLMNRYISARESWYRIGRLLESPDQSDDVDRQVATGTARIDVDPETSTAEFIAHVSVPLCKGDKSVLLKAPAPLEVSQIDVVVLSAAVAAAVINAKKETKAEPTTQHVNEVEVEEDSDDETKSLLEEAQERAVSPAAGEAGKDGEKDAGKRAAEKETAYRTFPKTLLSLTKAVEIEQGQLVMVLGKIGTGKSILLNALLGHATSTSGKVSLGGKVAYAQQDAWLLNATVKKNITMAGQEDNEVWYNTITDVCQLRADLAQFDKGDATEIGERGINLSGGQKQRVSLARACYSEADVLLLDDPLSALDAGTQRRVMDQCVCGVLKGRTIVLATHQTQYAHRADHIIVLGAKPSNDTVGDVLFSGSYAAYQDYEAAAANKSPGLAPKSPSAAPKSPALTPTSGPSKSPVPETHRMDKVTERLYLSVETEGDDLIPTSVTHVLADKVDSESRLAESTTVIAGYTEALLFLKRFHELEADSVLLVRATWAPALLTAYYQTAEGIPFEEAAQRLQRNRDATGSINSEDKDKLMRDEERAIGSVGGAVYLSYLSATGGFWMWIPIFMFLATAQVATSGSDLWLSWWSRDHFPYFDVGESEREKWYKIVYGSFIGGIHVFWFLTAYTAYTGFRRASKKLHKNMLRHILAAPTSFFDTTPNGRILNRFTDDIFQIDTLVPTCTFWFLFGVAMSVGSISIQAYTKPVILAVVGALAVVYLYTVYRYLPSQRETKRMDAMNRSPILAHFSQTINGCKTVVAHNLQGSFIARNRETLDASALTTFATIYLPQYLAVRLAVIGALIVGAFVGLSVQSRLNEASGVNAATETLGINNSVGLAFFLNFIVTLYSQLEASMASVERVLQYSKDGPGCVPQEVLSGDDNQNNWPGKDVSVSFKNVSLRYRPELPLVVDNLSFEINAGERIGVVGGTGVGKSTVMTALFRFVEIEGGEVRLGGQNVKTVAMRHLRRQLSMVPQDPVLFRGTVRHNLDPFDTSTDEEVWAALDKVSMTERIESHDGKLAGAISEKASNFSLGERALLCLARAMLKSGTRVLLIDEATANIDMKTDVLVQKAIRESFEGYTVITIAHRLQTVIDSDRLFILGRPSDGQPGTIVESGTPKELIEKRGVFYESFLSSLPEDEKERLVEIAMSDNPREAYLKTLQ